MKLVKAVCDERFSFLIRRRKHRLVGISSSQDKSGRKVLPWLQGNRTLCYSGCGLKGSRLPSRLPIE